jgi:DNA-binding transcriptional MerR regulator
MLDFVPQPAIGDFRFRPPDRGKMWAGLALTIRQAAAVTGVSERQIQHWLNRGYLPISIEGNRRLSGNALDLIALIQQARKAGVPLRRAVQLSNEHLARLNADPLVDTGAGSQTLSELEEKLHAATSAIEAVRKVMQELKASASARESSESNGV